jgi:signal transduction histidine kinase
VAAFDPSALAAGLLTSISEPGAATVLLLSKEGHLLYQNGLFDHSLPHAEHAGAAEALRGEWGVNYTQSSSQHSGSHGEHVVAFAPVPPLGWGLVIEESWEDIASPLLSTTQSAPLVLAPLLILAMLALWFGARQIVQPLQALEQRAARLARGDFQSIRTPVGGINEIQHLQAELAAMAQAVQAAQDSLHGYIGALTAGVENERSALARELHDDTLQALIALNQRVQLASLQTPDPTQRQSLRELQASVTTTITNLRRAIGGLRPIYLEDLGLAAALGMLCRQVSQSAGFPVDFAHTGAETRLPPAAELALYRIAQEALSNASRHARPTRASLTLAFQSGGAVLSLHDDGQGFTVPGDPNAFARQGHYGLLGMRERAELIGASFAIESGQGAGTRIRVTYHA